MKLRELKHGDVFSVLGGNADTGLFLCVFTNETKHAVFLGTRDKILTNATSNMNTNGVPVNGNVHFNFLDVLNQTKDKIE